MPTKPTTPDRLTVGLRQITALAKTAPTATDVAEFLALMGSSTHTTAPQPRIGCTTDQEDPS